MTHNTREELRKQIIDEMNARRIDYKTYIDSEWLLSEYEKILHTSLVAAVEKLPPNPDNDHEADVYRKGYNRAIDHFLTIINSIFKE